MSEDVVYAKTSVVVAHAGRRIGLKAGEPWDPSDPLVEAYPDMFVNRVPAVRSTVDPRGFRENVERATRAPGEKRAVRRGRKPRDEQNAGQDTEQPEGEDTTGEE